MSAGGGHGGEQKLGLGTRVLIRTAQAAGALLLVEGCTAGIISNNDGADRAADQLRAHGYTELDHTSTAVVVAGYADCDWTDSMEFNYTAQRPDIPVIGQEGGVAEVSVCMGAFQDHPTVIDEGLVQGLPNR
jgi:hypothetical protein